MRTRKRPKAGEAVVLTRVPAGLLNGLPDEDQEAINEIVGKTVLLVGYDERGKAELEFTDRKGTIHYIYVDVQYLRAST